LVSAKIDNGVTTMFYHVAKYLSIINVWIIDALDSAFFDYNAKYAIYSLHIALYII